MNLFRVLVAIICLGSIGEPRVFAQIAANLRGRVLDPSGAGVPNANVELIESAKNVHQSTSTSSTGDYLFTNLNPGTYRLVVKASGFKTLERTSITAAVGQTVSADLTLSLGGNQETVTVDSDYPVMQVGTSDIQTNISGTTIAAMPLNTRNFIQLSQLAPGVELPPGTLLPRINGGRPRTNEYIYDGISALQPEPGQVAYFPILDDIQEFTIEANNVAAEFGRFNGGVVNVATRSGSNAIHGSLFEYFRNEDLNSRNYFASATARKPEYRRNLYGATLGAPIIHDKLFFFGDYQGVKQLIGVTRISTIPTMAMRQGIFTGVSKIFDPTTTQTVGGTFVRKEFPNDVINIPFDSAAKSLLARYPTPTTSGAANNYTRTANDSDHQNQFDVRVDGTFRDRDRAFGRYTYYHEVELPVTPLPEGSGAVTGAVLGTGGVVGLSNVLGQQAVFNETHTFSARVLNNLAFGLYATREHDHRADPGDDGLCGAGDSGHSVECGLQQCAAAVYADGHSTAWTVCEHVSSSFRRVCGRWWIRSDITRGAHAIKAGLDFRWYQLNTVSPPNPTGSFAFTTTGTNQQGVTNSGNSVASFLLGQVDTFHD